jgi:hypothetical protein
MKFIIYLLLSKTTRWSRHDEINWRLEGELRCVFWATSLDYHVTPDSQLPESPSSPPSNLGAFGD